MASKNVEMLRKAHECWNRRDFDGIVRDAADNLVYIDQARKLTLNGKHKFKEWTQAWAKACSDGKITKAQYIDAGDTVITQFTVEGTNDGPFAGLPPTGRTMSFPFCEICHFDKNGKMVSSGCYYDQYTILTQLGHVEPLTKAA